MMETPATNLARPVGSAATASCAVRGCASRPMAGRCGGTSTTVICVCSGCAWTTRPPHCDCGTSCSPKRNGCTRQQAGQQLVGTLKDLGTVPVMAYSLPDVVAFYPDGAWWIPCIMQQSAGLLEIADSLGIDDSFCPVRAMLGAFVNREHFPIPELLDLQRRGDVRRLVGHCPASRQLGHSVFWWEIPHRRWPQPGEEAVSAARRILGACLPGGVCPRRTSACAARSWSPTLGDN